jgi:hypothetical protein
MRNKQPTLVLTGQHKKRRHIVNVGGVEIGLTGSLFGALCELAAARLANAGPVALSRVYVHRLRRALEQATRRAGYEYSLIDPVSKGNYVLALSPGRIRVAESFREVLLTGGMPPATAKRLLK